MLIWEGDEIKCWSPNFVILRKNNILRLKHCRREKWSWTNARHILYRFQYRNIIWGHLKKVWRKKIFSLKSMTKLEDLTVLFYSSIQSFILLQFIICSATTYFWILITWQHGSQLLNTYFVPNMTDGYTYIHWTSTVMNAQIVGQRPCCTYCWLFIESYK